MNKQTTSRNIVLKLLHLRKTKQKLFTGIQYQRHQSVTSVGKAGHVITVRVDGIKRDYLTKSFI